MYNSNDPNKPPERPTNGQRDDRRVPATSGRTGQTGTGRAVGAGPSGQHVSGPQEAAEHRAYINEQQRQKKLEERAERERIEKERAARDELARNERREKNLEVLRNKQRAMEMDRRRRLRESWDKRVFAVPKEEKGAHAKAPSRSKSHQSPPPGAGPQDRMAEDQNRRVPLKKRSEKRPTATSPDTIDILDEDEELQMALQESLQNSQPASAPDVHDVDDDESGEEKYYEDDEEMQKALMMSAQEPQQSAPPTSTTTQATTTSHAQPPPLTTTHTASNTTASPAVYDVDGDVDMDVGDDPELQAALMQSLGTHDSKPAANSQGSLPDKEKDRRARIFGSEPTIPQAPTMARTRVYGADEDEADEAEFKNDSELQDALRLSRQVIDVDQQGTREFGGSVEDYPSPSGAPVITGIDDEPEAAEDEDEELQRALMSSLNPNASPAPVRRTEPPRRETQRTPQRSSDPSVNNARRIRNEQDWAYQQSLAEDREKERKAQEQADQERIKKEQEEAAAKHKEMEETARRELRDKAGTLLPQEPKEGQGVTIGIRMPNGTRFMRRFNPTDTLQDLRYFIESKANESNLSQDYEITSDFPKKTFHDLPVTNTLAEVGISGRMLLNLLEK